MAQQRDSIFFDKRSPKSARFQTIAIPSSDTNIIVVFMPDLVSPTVQIGGQHVYFKDPGSMARFVNTKLKDNQLRSVIVLIDKKAQQDEFHRIQEEFKKHKILEYYLGRRNR